MNFFLSIGRKIVFASLCVLAFACGPRTGAPKAPQVRNFPSVEVPTVYTDPDERVAWMTSHFWDRYLDTAQVFLTDSLTLNGVRAEAVEKEFGTFVTLLGMTPLHQGVATMDRFFSQAEAFGQRDREVFTRLSEWVRKYLYDPNSPVRSEDLYLPWIQRQAASALTDDAYRAGYGWDARMCALNRIGTPAADFVFIDTKGRRQTLYGIRAEYTLLIFGNPGCAACQELMTTMSADPQLSALIDSGRLKVVDIYIDDEIDNWKAHKAEYPAQWINGYDPDSRIRMELLYNVRGIPSLYLLDAEKTVLLKDAPQENLLAALSRL